MPWFRVTWAWNSSAPTESPSPFPPKGRQTVVSKICDVIVNSFKQWRFAIDVPPIGRKSLCQICVLLTISFELDIFDNNNYLHLNDFYRHFQTIKPQGLFIDNVHTTGEKRSYYVSLIQKNHDCRGAWNTDPIVAMGMLSQARGAYRA
jgi:hypothetical protein